MQNYAVFEKRQDILDEEDIEDIVEALEDFVTN